MDTIVQNPPSEVRKQQNDHEEGQQLFDQMSMSDQNPFENLDLSSQAIPAQQQSQQQENKSQEVMDFKEMMKQSKKQKKKEKRKNKLKAAKHKQASKKQNINTNIVSEKNTKRIKKMVMDSSDEQIQQQKQQTKQKSSKKLKQRKNSQSQQNLSKASDESAQYSEEQNLSSQSDNKKGEEIEQQGTGNDKQGRSKRKRLGKKSRMQRILQKQGFDLKQLGNDGQANYELNQSVNDSDDSFSSTGKKKKSNKKVKREKKEKKPQLSNEQFLSKLKEIGCEDQVQENDSQRYNYDSGIEQLTKLKPKKETKNTIKVQNKLFGNLEMEIQQQINTQQNNELPQGEIPTQKLQLQFKPKTIASSRAGSFLSKVQTMKKHRGLEADIDQAEFDKMAKEKAKRSIYQLVSKIQNEIEENEEIDIEIKAPAIAKGKSADLINNTMFIVKNLTSKNMNNTSADNIGINESDQPLDKNNGENGTQIKNVEKKMNIEQSSNFTLGIKKKPISRSEFFKQIKESINVRRSKYVSAQELKNSFKPSKLQQLQEIRQKRQERRKKQAMYELGQVQDDDAENVIRELQDEVARHERISKDDLRRLLRQQQGMEELDEYEEEDEKKKNKKNKDNEVDQKQKNNEENKIQKESTQKLTKPTISAQANNNNNIKNIEQKQSASEHEQKHADDMIDEYDDDQQPIKQNDQQQQQQQEQMDVQQEDDEGYQNDQQQQNQLQEQQQEGQDKKEDEQIQRQQQQEGKKEQDDIKKTQMLKQLQQQGIIMPGVNNKRKNLSKIIDQEIDPLKYIIDEGNNVQENDASLLMEQKKQQTLPLLNGKQETLEFKQFKKLRKIAVVIQEKKKKREQQLKRAKEFFEQQAQLGSDNEENDDNVKAINRKDDSEQEDGEQLDQQLEELIDNAVDINEEDQDLAFRKYMQDVKEKDREQLQRILRGDFRRHNQDMPQLQQMEEDEKNRFERMQKMMEWMRRRQDDEKGLYADDSEDEDDQKNFYYDYNGNRKRINHKQKVTAQHHEEQSQQENQQQVQQKLRYFLMDTISPAKNHSFQSKPSQLLTQLPQMFKKTNKPFNKPFAKFDLGLNKQENHKKINESQEQKKNKNFAGNLFTLGSNKGEANGLTKPKMKKTTSHMSQQLNKHKVQKPMMGSIPQNKLNAIFSRFSKPTKK